MARVLEAGEGGGALECLAQRVYAISSVVAIAIVVDATQLIVGEAASRRSAL